VSATKTRPKPARKPPPAPVLPPARPTARLTHLAKAVGSWTARCLGQWLGVFIIGLMHLWTVTRAAQLGWLPLQIVCYAAPAGLLLILRPGCRRHAYRFLAPLVIAYVAIPQLQIMAYLAVFCWVIRQSWFLDASPTDPRLRDLVRGPRRKGPAR
jgi:hypothetical protein